MNNANIVSRVKKRCKQKLYEWYKQNGNSRIVFANPITICHSLSLAEVIEKKGSRRQQMPYKQTLPYDKGLDGWSMPIDTKSSRVNKKVDGNQG